MSDLKQDYTKLKTEFEDFQKSVYEDQSTFLEFQQGEHIKDLEEELALYKKRFSWIIEQHWIERASFPELHVREIDNFTVYKSLIIEAIDKELR